MNQTVDYYKILQVHRGAGKDDITAAYRKLCKIYHPDVNTSPNAEEVMKQINLAYSALTKGASAAAIRQDAQNKVHVASANAAVSNYFAALLEGDFRKSYNLISEHDRKYVTYQGFCEWRKSVQKLFVMRDYTIKATGQVHAHKLKDGEEVPALNHTISIVEKNTVTQAVDNYTISKLAILESGGWHIFLGYRDISEIAKVFEDLSAKQVHGEMARHWEEYCSNTCRDLNMLNLRGLLQNAETELYRHKRYKQQMTVACFQVKPASSTHSGGLTPEAIETAARTIVDSLRETDIPAYLGGGVFAVLFVELRKRHAEIITQRIVNKLKTNVHKNLKMSIYAECRFSIYEGGSLEDYISRCSSF